MSYRTIMADPPWRFNNRSNRASPDFTGAYKTMALDQICSLPVQDLVYGDAWLFLWVPASFRDQAAVVIDAWGFVATGSEIIWVKGRVARDKPIYHIGLGNYVRMAHEILLIAKRGRPPCKRTSQPSVFFAPRRRHSQKPDEIYPIIEGIADGPYLELFARQRREGWDGWGDQIDSDPSVDAILKGGCS
jgi:N6-adenosine-specific RNA methylase IME4